MQRTRIRLKSLEHFRAISPLLFGSFMLVFAALSACQGSQKPGQHRVTPKAPTVAVYWNKVPLSPNAFAPLPLGSIKPQGWLRRQLQIQADGLTGHLDEFWPNLEPNSGWMDGSVEAWQRGPYYMDGLVPLAYLLGDEKLIAKAKKWVSWTLENQQPDGRIGTVLGSGQYQSVKQEVGSADLSDIWWPNMIILKVLTQYQEAANDPRVIPVIERYLKYQLKTIYQFPLRGWAQHRWGEEVLSLVWFYNRTGNQLALELARQLHQQGFDWNAHFADFKYKEKILRDQTNLHTHVVNNAMAMKTSAEWWQVSGEESDRKAINQLLEVMDRFHGQPNGVHSGDEHYAGLDPSQGTELCAVVEGMFSFEQLLAILGDATFGDRLERIAFNALPAAFKKDMWAHQYDQQVNQVMCSVLEGRNWTTNGPDSNIFGLEPNYPCCTSNMHQGWPKFASHLWMATPQGGLAAVTYAPSRVDARVRDGVEVAIIEETDYPFRGSVRMVVYPATPVRFPLKLRIPAWAANAGITVQGVVEANVVPGSFHLIDRKWKYGEVVELEFPMDLRVTRQFQNGVVVNRGPLVFSLLMGEDWKQIKGEAPHADWEVYPTTPWNYGLVIDPDNPVRSVAVEERPVGDRPFSPEGAPVRLEGRGRRVPDWKVVVGSAGPLPLSPVRTREPDENIVLIPYGCTNLRITVFPLIQP